MRSLLPIFCLLAFNAAAQQASYFDAAQAYNRLIVEKKQGALTRVGIYKVAGSPYLFGGNKEGLIFQTGDSGRQAVLSYNFYNNEISFTAKPTNELLTKQPGTINSFILRADPSIGLNQDIVFLYGPLLGMKEKLYFQLVYRGADYSLYKKYSSELQIVSDNYAQSDLRQFSVLVDYYYAAPGKKELRKLKTNGTELKELRELGHELR